MITGALGQSWRAEISPWGDLIGRPGSTERAAASSLDGRPLAWHVAADDRWHSPSAESSTRQTRIDGTPVTETRLRIPQGSAVQRIWTVADHGGITMVEVRNDSPLPIAVAFTRADLLTTRPPSSTPAEGIDLPSDSLVFPVGHASSVVVGIAHAATRRAGPLPPGLATADDAVRAWRAMSERASRLELPNQQWSERVVAARCDAALAGPEAWQGDPVDALVGAGERARMGERLEDELPELAAALEAVIRSESTWARRAALHGGARVLRACGERRALSDLRRAAQRTADRRHDGPTTTADVANVALPAAPPDGILAVAWVEAQCAVTRREIAGQVDLVPQGYGDGWLGAPVEAHGIDVSGLADTVTRVGWAIRWHGARPAVLWEQAGTPATLRAPAVAPDWTSDAPTGEALWPAPPER